MYGKVYRLKTVGLRYFNVFGPRQNPDGAYAAVIPKWIGRILNGERITINGDGETSRDFCYVQNVVQLNILAAHSDSESREASVFNVALNDRTSLNNLFELISSACDKNVEGLEIKPPEYQDFRAGDVRHSQADISKAIEQLGYQPSHRISEGILETVRWHLECRKNESE